MKVKFLTFFTMNISRAELQRNVMFCYERFKSINIKISNIIVDKMIKGMPRGVSISPMMKDKNPPSGGTPAQPKQLFTILPLDLLRQR
ncbi:hypothetical protein XT32_004682 [Salmonella enterica subsp. enterica]|nr:hypothetical protein [Salmonella enterica subsp. enterica]